MSDIEGIRKAMGKSESELRAINPELVKSIVELGFKQQYDQFSKDGEPRVLYQGAFLGDTFPLYLIYQSENTDTLFSYEEMKTIFQNIFRRDVQGEISDYPMYLGESTLTQGSNLPDSLNAYIDEKVKTETTSYLLKSKGDGILRKIEYTRFFNIENNSPIAEKWEGKSWNASGVVPSDSTDKRISVFIS
jgi:hypothetical protein